MPQNPTEAPASIKMMLLYELLIFSGRPYTLSELRDKTGYSRQTIIRLVEQLDRHSRLGAVKTWKEGRERLYQMALASRPRPDMTEDEIRIMAACRDIAAGILPGEYGELAKAALAKAATALLPDLGRREEVLASIIQTRTMGSIDYGPHAESIDSLRRAIREKRVCIIDYHKLKSPEAASYEVAVTGLQRHSDSLYAVGWKVAPKGTPVPVREITLAVHRIKGIRPTRRIHGLALPDDRRDALYGFPQNDPVKVRVHFTRGVDQYIRERFWSEGQHMEELPDGSIILTFYSQSDNELFAKIMSFGVEATVIEPPSLQERICRECAALLERYSSG